MPTPPHGYVLLERHIEKNAGSTFREILFQNELRGRCMYWGYQLRSVAWNSFIPAMYNLSTEDIPPRICIEAHSHIDHVTTWVQRFEQMQEMRAHFERRPELRNKVVMTLRLREPFSHYVSYYLWTVVERQHRRPDRFGSSFEQWARSVPNLQTELLLSSKAAFTASYAPVGNKDLVAWKRNWDNPEIAAQRRSLAVRMASGFDVLGTTERFDETTLLVAQALNWSTADAAQAPSKRDAAPQPSDSCMTHKRGYLAGLRNLGPWPWWCRVLGRDKAAEQRRVHLRVCPNQTACALLIRQIAPVDHELYALAKTRLAAAIARAGPSWGAQVAEVKRINRAPKRSFDREMLCAWRTIRPMVIGGKEAEKNLRRIVYAAAPNFTSSETACIPGAQQVMKHIWAEHRMGGRMPLGFPMGSLVPYTAAFPIKYRLRLESLIRAQQARRNESRGTRRAPKKATGRRNGRTRTMNRTAVPSRDGRRISTQLSWTSKTGWSF